MTATTGGVATSATTHASTRLRNARGRKALLPRPSSSTLVMAAAASVPPGDHRSRPGDGDDGVPARPRDRPQHQQSHGQGDERDDDERAAEGPYRRPHE